ncbi:MAG TPA: ROK family protein [Actinobacteria bacterium]|nr:ROK family protein [Actinomycetota bacterium]
MATIGVDLGGTKILALRCEDGTVVARHRTTTPRTPDGTVAAIHEAARALGLEGVEAVGVGIAGLVRWPEGSFAWGPHVAGSDLPLRIELEGTLGVPVVVDNDANVAALAEHRLGAAVGYRNVIMVTLGTGIGGGIVVDGRIYRGESFAGEWGHMLYDPHGILCDCGKRGCWETVASGPALVRLAREVIELNPDSSFAVRFADTPVTGEAITAAADAGDEIARGLVAQVGAHLGRGICSLIAILDPEVVVVGGGLGSVGESVVAPARRVAADCLHGSAHRMLPPILVAALGPDAGAIGAALLAADHVEGVSEARR